MSHDKTDLAGSERVLSPADEALLSELLPPLDERPGPARRRSGANSDATARAIVEAALAEQERTIPMEVPKDEVVVPIRRWGSRRRPLVMVAAAVALFSLGAGAAVLAARVYRAVAPRPVPVPVAAERRASPVASVAVEEAVEPEAEAEVEVVSPEPQATPLAKHRVLHSKKHRSAPKVGSAPPAASGLLDEVDLASAPLEDLLALANRLRRGREWRSADEVYRAVIDRFPSSDAAVVAEIASSTLRLEKLGDATGALEGYQRALGARPTGALAEEARWGIVEALRVVGDRAGEATAVKEFLAHHPVSALAPAARRRAAELGL